MKNRDRDEHTTLCERYWKVSRIAHFRLRCARTAAGKARSVARTCRRMASKFGGEKAARLATEAEREVPVFESAVQSMTAVVDALEECGRPEERTDMAALREDVAHAESLLEAAVGMLTRQN